MIKFNSSLALLGIIISLTSVSIYAQTSYVKNSLGAEHTLLPLTGSALMSTLETGNGLKATYFNNKTLSGFPSVTRTGGNINYNWGAGSPDPAVHSDGFSARWAGQIKPRYSETYTFYTQSDDGISLWVNDTLLIYSWSDHSVMEDSATITLTAGTKYNIVAEYYENAGQAIAKLWWKSNSQPKEVVPISQLYSDGQIPVTPTTNGLKAYYFNNTTLSGTPALTRIDREINFDWQYGSPDVKIQHDNFSVRWVGQVKPRYSETYLFSAQKDEGIRVWIDGNLLIDGWDHHSYIINTGSITLVAGKKYNLMVEYFEGGGYANASLSWFSPGQNNEVVPATQLFSDESTLPVYGLKASYFNNKTLSGSPSLIRTDPAINFDWQYGSPDSLIPNDGFSVRWEGKLKPKFSRPYTLYTQSDDGVRLWLNNNLLIDNWTNHSFTEDQATINLDASTSYHIVMEYYENVGSATAKLFWSSDDINKEVVARPYLITDNPELIAATIASGNDFNILIKTDGTLWSWGMDDMWQLGDGGRIKGYCSLPIQIGTDTHWKEVDASMAGSMALKTDGTLWYWGNGIKAPTQFNSETNWAHTSFWLAIKTDGTLWNLLKNPAEQIGTDKDWKIISKSSALKTDGTLWDIKIVILTQPNYEVVPVQVGTASDWWKVQGGFNHSLAIKNNGTLWGWGDNSLGELGDGTTINRIEPVQIGADTDWRLIGAGRNHSMATKNNGTMWAWGNNQYGQLGLGIYDDNITVPAQVPYVFDPVQMNGGEQFSVILSSDNQLCGAGNSSYTGVGLARPSVQYNCTPFPSNTKSAPEGVTLQQATSLKSYLLQSYPNPTQGIATIPYVLEEDAMNAKIVLSNLMNSIMREYPLHDKGKSGIEINMSDLPSGIYFYSLIINNTKVDGKKLLLVK